MLLRRPALTLALVAGLLMAPSLIFGTLFSHSAATNLNWAEQFANQFRAGVLYPRWLSESFRGLGSPAFYFYPPLPFWVDALVDAVTFNAFSVSYRLAITATVLLFASGVAMHAWLSDEAASPRVALVGAGLYMAAPYHLLDHYLRGAFAEFAAFVPLPMVMLALNRIADRKRHGVVLLAISYAALLLSHLPTALVASVTLLPAYVLWRVRRPEAVLGGVLGIGLAAVYVGPAMSLQEWISADWLWSSFYRIDAWFFQKPDLWPDAGMMQIIVLLAACYAFVAAAVGLRMRAVGFWIVLCLGCLVLISGIVPWFWQLPQLAKVQFPWRLMTVVEFAAITALCTAPSFRPRGPTLWLFAAAAMALVSAGILIEKSVVEGIVLSRPYMPLPRIDAKEYLPHGFPGATTDDQKNPAFIEAAASPLIACTPAVRLCRAKEGAFGAIDIEVDGDAPSKAVLHRFFFPSWRLDGSLGLSASEPFKLLSFEAPAGRSSVKLARVALPVERWSQAISAMSLAILVGMAWFGARRRPG